MFYFDVTAISSLPHWAALLSMAKKNKNTNVAWSPQTSARPCWRTRIIDHGSNPIFGLNTTGFTIPDKLLLVQDSPGVFSPNTASCCCNQGWWQPWGRTKNFKKRKENEKNISLVINIMMDPLQSGLLDCKTTRRRSGQQTLVLLILLFSYWICLSLISSQFFRCLFFALN